MEILKFIFSSFWIWLGFMVILSGFINLIYHIIIKFMRYRTLKKLGYPPSHCDVDGDSKISIKEYDGD